MSSFRLRSAPYGLALFGGVLVAVGIPPLGWWPLSIAGVACYFVAAECSPSRFRTQFALGALFGWGWLAPAMGWMWHLVPGGFVIAPLLFAGMHGLSAAVASRLFAASNSVANEPNHATTSRILVRAATHGLAEALRFVVPFGGVPLASIALGVADTRLAHIARVVGPIGVSVWLFVLAGVLAEIWIRRREFGWHSRRGAMIVLILLIGTQIFGQFAPHGRATGESLRIAAVQGGGPQGVLAINSNPRDVTDRHLAATALLNKDQGLDLVVWPENAIDVDDFTTSSARSVLTQEAIRIDAPIAVGVTEDAGRAFTNAQILLSTSGAEASRYDKVRRVPYGEYIPLRSLLASLGAPVDRIPRDAAAGTERAVLTMPHNGQNVPLAVAISWEVFFSDRVNDGVSMGGQLVINPTNGSSYTGEILQQQQVATSQLRALESGRYLVQAATTGYTVFIDHKGHVLQRIPVGEQAVIFADVPLRTGRTLFSHIGTWPVVLALFVVIGVLVRRARSPHSLRSSRVAP